MCGIVGIVGTSAVNQRIYDALTVLQHRGQDAAGIATSVDGELYTRKGSGLVRDVFQQHHMLELKGNYGIGHVRYPTAGCDSASEAQPFYVNAPYGICIAHNGNLTNATELAEAIRAAVPSMEMVRLVNSGTEATMSAIRLARAFTGRDLTVKFEGCYHGHVDSLLVKAGSGMATLGIADTQGVPRAFCDTTIALAFNSVDALEQAFRAHGAKIASVIVEPVATWV